MGNGEKMLIINPYVSAAEAAKVQAAQTKLAHLTKAIAPEYAPLGLLYCSATFSVLLILQLIIAVITQGAAAFVFPGYILAFAVAVGTVGAFAHSKYDQRYEQRLKVQAHAASVTIDVHFAADKVKAMAQQLSLLPEDLRWELHPLWEEALIEEQKLHICPTARAPQKALKKLLATVTAVSKAHTLRKNYEELELLEARQSSYQAHATGDKILAGLHAGNKKYKALRKQ